MLLKKQTVWLLTMLSLVVVLSVYYVTSPDGNSTENVAFEQDGVNEENTDVTTEGDGEEGAEGEAVEEGAEGAEVKIEEADDGSMISAISSDELFTALRMEVDEYRSKVRSQLQTIVASKDVSATEKSEAYEKMTELQEVSTKEDILEMLIKGKGYEDALVRADGGEVRVTVKSKENSRTEANKIIRLVRSEIGDLQEVAVEFEPTE
jgi:stage III sporulation protein AH